VRACVGLTVFICCLFFFCRSPKKEKTEAIQKEPTRINLMIKNVKIAVEVVATEEKRMLGLMYRSALAQSQGMLFIFDQTGIYPFYMKNTKIPLSIAFIDSNGIILDIQQMTPFDEQTEHYPNNPFLYALETNQGWFLEQRIIVGDTVFGIAKYKE
jgi:uncharacterized membrane protein (UPF0127 family)